MELTKKHLEDFARIMNRLIDANIRMGTAELWPVDQVAHVQIDNANAREDMAKIARMMGKAKKKLYENYELNGEIDGVSVKAYTGREAVCKIVGYEEVEVPAEPETVLPNKPARIERKPIYDCSEPILADTSPAESEA